VVTANGKVCRLRKAKDMSGYKLRALAGEIGAVQDFYFDDQSWTVRNTGG